MCTSTPVQPSIQMPKRTSLCIYMLHLQGLASCVPHSLFMAKSEGDVSTRYHNRPCAASYRLKT